jgi:uncharacterized protein
MWEIYDDLIELMPKDVVIEEFLAGLHWFLVRSLGVGMAMTPGEGQSSLSYIGGVAGKTVYEASQYIKSWNNFEAAMGLAAINSIINKPLEVEKFAGFPLEEQKNVSVFEYLKDAIKGKKVAVVGHFRDLEQISPICSLSVLERRPMTGDLPDPACEYILPQQDFVFITATTLINKTLPRLLELSRNSYIVLVGPSTPLTPCLFKHGIDMLAGNTIIDGQRVWKAISEGDQHSFFNDGGRMVKVVKK